MKQLAKLLITVIFLMEPWANVCFCRDHRNRVEELKKNGQFKFANNDVPIEELLEENQSKMCHLCDARHFNDGVASSTMVPTWGDPLIKHPTLATLRFVRYHNTLEAITDLMIYWRRLKGTFFIDNSSEIIVEKAEIYLRIQLAKVDVHRVRSIRDIDMFVRRIEFTPVDVVVICGEVFTNALIQKANQLNLFSMNHTWIFASAGAPRQVFGVDITPESQVTLLVPLGTTPFGQLLATARHIDIYDVFFVPQSLRTELVKFADWNEVGRLSMLTRPQVTPNAGRALRGRRIRITVFQHEPYTFLRMQNGQLVITGYLKEMFDMILDTLNIRYSIKEVEEVFGIGINGTYTGFVGRLYRREADMAMNVLAVTNSRSSAVRYAGPVTQAHLAIIYNRPEATISPTLYILPFTPFVWFCIVTLLVVAVFFLAVVNLASTAVNRKSQSPASKDVQMSATYRIISFTFLEEVVDYPVGYAAKIFVATLLLATVVTFAYYTSVFTSFLTYREEKVPFRDMDDVATVSSDYTILIVRNTRHQDQFQYARTGVFADIWKRVVEQGNKSFERSFKSGLFKSYTGRYVYLSDGPTCMYLASTNCSVAFAPTKYTFEYYNMAHRADFPYTNFFKQALWDIIDGGVFSRLTTVYNLRERPPCGADNQNNSFGFDQVTGVFLSWILGVVTALVCLLLEKLVYKHCGSSSRLHHVKRKRASDSRH